MLMRRLGAALVLISAVSVQLVLADDQAGMVNVASASQSDLTLYPDKTLVRYTLSGMPSETGDLQVMGMPEKWDYDSLELGYPSQTGSVAPEQLFWQPGGLDRDAIYRGLVGKSVELLGGGLNVPVQGTLLSYHSRLALVKGTNGRQYLVDWNDPQGIRVAGRDSMVADSKLSSSVTARFNPEMINQINTDTPLRLSYVTPSIRYSNHYRMMLNSTGKARIELNARITNDSDTLFDKSTIRLVSGDTGRPVAYARSQQVMMEAAPAAIASAGDRVGEMLVKQLPEGVQLPPRSTQQVSLLRKDPLSVEKFYALDVYGRSYAGRNTTLERPKLTYRFKATTDLPSGPVKLYGETKEGVMIIAGESWLAQTTKGDLARLEMGEALTVRVERHMDASQQQDKSLTSQWRVIVHNDQDKAVDVVLVERDSALMKISEVKGATLDGLRTIKVKVPAKGSAEVGYQAQYRL